MCFKVLKVSWNSVCDAPHRIKEKVTLHEYEFFLIIQMCFKVLKVSLSFEQIISTQLGENRYTFNLFKFYSISSIPKSGRIEMLIKGPGEKISRWHGTQSTKSSQQNPRNKGYHSYNDKAVLDGIKTAFSCFY